VDILLKVLKILFMSPTAIVPHPPEILRLKYGLKGVPPLKYVGARTKDKKNIKKDQSMTIFEIR
jgi:hypothetical protein